MIKRLILLCISIVIISSCSKSTDLLSLVPDDSGFVGTINTKNIITKSGTSINDNEVIIANNIRKITKSDSLLIPLIVKSLNTDYKSVLFGMTNDIEYAFLFNIKDASFIDEYISSKYKTSNVNGNTICSKGNLIIAYNDAVCMVAYMKYELSEQKREKLIERILNNSSKSIKENHEAMQSLNSDNDICLYSKTLQYLDFLYSDKNDINSNILGGIISDYFKDLIKYNTSTIDFNTDNVAFLSKSVINERSKLQEIVNTTLLKVDADILKLLPENPIILFTIAAKGSEIANSEEFRNIIKQSRGMLMGYDKALIQATNTINGTIAYCVAGTIDNQSTTIAIKSSNPELMLRIVAANQFFKFRKENGIYVYHDENKKYEMSIFGSYFMIKINAQTKPSKKTAFDNVRIKPIVSNSLFTAYFNYDKSYKYFDKYEGYGYFKISSLNDIEAKLFITSPKSKNILVNLLDIVSKAQYQNEKDKTSSDYLFEDSEDYNYSGEPLEDIYEN